MDPPFFPARQGLLLFRWINPTCLFVRHPSPGAEGGRWSRWHQTPPCRIGIRRRFSALHQARQEGHQCAQGIFSQHFRKWNRTTGKGDSLCVCMSVRLLLIFYWLTKRTKGAGFWDLPGKSEELEASPKRKALTVSALRTVFYLQSLKEIAKRKGFQTQRNGEPGKRAEQHNLPTGLLMKKNPYTYLSHYAWYVRRLAVLAAAAAAVALPPVWRCCRFLLWKFPKEDIQKFRKALPSRLAVWMPASIQRTKQSTDLYPWKYTQNPSVRPCAKRTKKNG